MKERPELTRQLDGQTFRSYYYLKEELVRFLRDNQLPTSGGKLELIERIAAYLDMGAVLPASARRPAAFGDNPGRSLTEAIACWNHRKRQQGHHCYERSDLAALDE